jgi:hypothetical protein
MPSGLVRWAPAKKLPTGQTVRDSAEMIYLSMPIMLT